MRTASLSRILRRLGNSVTLFRPGEDTGRAGFGLLQALPEGARGEQILPSPLGLVRDERFLYLGEAALSLEESTGGFLLWQGKAYDIVSAQPVYLGSKLSHWRAIVRLREEAGG